MRSSAEWIAEAPTSKSGIIRTLADFGTVLFGQNYTPLVAGTCYATLAGQLPKPIGSLSWLQITLNNQSNKAVPSSLSVDGSSFSVESFDLYGKAVLADKPVAYYRLGEAVGSSVAVDSSEKGNNGTYENGALLGEPGLIVSANTAVNFASGDVVISDAADLNFVSVPFTIEAWINGPLSVPLTNQRVFDKAQAGAPEGYVLDLGPSNVRLAGCTNLEMPFPLSDNITYHIVGVSDGAGTGYIYVNGVLAGSGPYSSCNPYTGSAHIAVANDGTAHFDGVIDEVAVYNHALSAQRILAHYNIGTGQ
jgi:hypothetical protein